MPERQIAKRTARPHASSDEHGEDRLLTSRETAASQRRRRLYFCRLRRRTPGPPPFSSMKSTPAP
jgi:hypothetical protein